jgi:hypothetical protein
VCVCWLTLRVVRLASLSRTLQQRTAAALRSSVDASPSSMTSSVSTTHTTAPVERDGVTVDDDANEDIDVYTSPARSFTHIVDDVSNSAVNTTSTTTTPPRELRLSATARRLSSDAATVYRSAVTSVARTSSASALSMQRTSSGATTTATRTPVSAGTSEPTQTTAKRASDGDAANASPIDVEIGD